jgi:hypothetical protein
VIAVTLDTGLKIKYNFCGAFFPHPKTGFIELPTKHLFTHPFHSLNLFSGHIVVHLLTPAANAAYDMQEPAIGQAS